LQKKEKFLFLVEVLALTVCVEVSKTASPKQRIDRPSSDTPQLFRYNHPPGSVLAGDFFCKKDFFCKRKIKVRFLTLEVVVEG
jgi:hypothetical protein